MFKKIINWLKTWLSEEEGIELNIWDNPPIKPHPKYWEPLPVENEPIYVVNPLTEADLQRLKKKSARKQKQKQGEKK